MTAEVPALEGNVDSAERPALAPDPEAVWGDRAEWLVTLVRNRGGSVDKARLTAEALGQRTTWLSPTFNHALEHAVATRRLYVVRGPLANKWRVMLPGYAVEEKMRRQYDKDAGPEV